MMNTKSLSQLPQLFRSPFLRKIAIGNYFKELSERLEIADMADLLRLKLAEIFEHVYATMLRSYRSEYVFKNELVRHWFNSKKSLEQSYLTDEFRVGKCRVDLAIFSGTSMAFEIKTDFDSATRLAFQSSEYAKVFDLVYVVTTQKMLAKLIDSIPHTAGILTLEPCGGFTTVRASQAHAHQLNLLAAFNCLRQGERLSIAEQISGKKLEISVVKLYTECKRKFRTLLPFDAHARMNEQIRHRTCSGPTGELMEAVPQSLKHAAFTLRATGREMRQIREELHRVPRQKSKTTKSKNEHIFSIS